MRRLILLCGLALPACAKEEPLIDRYGAQVQLLMADVDNGGMAAPDIAAALRKSGRLDADLLKYDPSVDYAKKVDALLDSTKGKGVFLSALSVQLVDRHRKRNLDNLQSFFIFRILEDDIGAQSKGR